MILGIIGGLGPMATAYFMELITRMTEAGTDQEHLELLIHSKPSVPDRTEFILHKSDRDPAPYIIEMGQALAGQGADYIAIPCITAHGFHARLQDGIPIPVLNAVQLTARAMAKAGIKRAGVMATDGTIQCGLFQDALNAEGIQAVLPSEGGQKKVMDLIYKDIKTNHPADRDRFSAVKEELVSLGAEVIILGCTELSLIKRNADIGPGFADVMEILAAEAIRVCGKQISSGVGELITRLPD